MLRILALSVLVPALCAACSGPRVEADRAPARPAAPAPPGDGALPPASPVFGWRCEDGTRLATRYDAASGALEIADSTALLRLPRAVAASGARWAGGDTDFHSKGDEALFVRAGDETRCVVDPVATADLRAAVAGAVFRALGNEPGWSLVIHPDRIEWVGDYGAVRRTFAEVAVRGDAAETIWRARDGAGQVEVQVLREVCRDDGDRSFPAQVRLRIDALELRGCGRPLEPPFEPSQPRTRPPATVTALPVTFSAFAR